MAHNIPTGQYLILSLTEGERPTSINHTEPGSQIVRLSEPVKVWFLKREGPESNTFWLSLGGYPYTGVINDKVTASTNPEVNVEWIATYRERQNAYTISPVYDKARGWTVPALSTTNPEIEVELLRATKSIPPQYPTSQLFKFVPVLDE